MRHAGCSAWPFRRLFTGRLRSVVVATTPFSFTEVNSEPPAAEQLRRRALVNYGHFTSMQARGRRVRGLDLHLRRLDAANRELFGSGVDNERVRDCLRHALVDVADATLRVDLFQSEKDHTDVMVTATPPADPPPTPQRLRSVPYQRPVAHIKHVGAFGQIYHGRLAERDGFDDALLTGPDGAVSEAAIANVGCFDGSGVTWPDAPALHGITMQLLESRLDAGGVPSRRGPVRLAELPSYATVFVCNSQGVAPVGQVDDTPLPVDESFMRTMIRQYESVAWDPI
ncbi:MAG: class IV aminotransferase [Micromonosporaceae bacterium]|nr:class IV aminotransferase [Micromonosporaceae bacterium]